MASNQLKNQHLMWRAGFGPAVSQLNQFPTLSPDHLFKALQKASSKQPAYIDVADDYLKGLFMGIGEAGQQARRNLDENERKMVRQKQRDSIRNLNLKWLNEMIHSEAQLLEKAAFFWHGHFASRNLNIFFQQELLNVIRLHALGSFRTLLHEVSKSAAMLNFLNAAQNRKDHPNENFAREVMELFTLGRGNYTEKDVKEAARAFTGWSANPRGEFVFRRFQHDTGDKTVLGKTGRLSGEDVLDHLLAQKQTAKFITAKLYRFFVHEKPDQAKIEWLANRFFNNEYHIGKLLEDIFTADWFYDEKNIGAQIKSPVELLAGIQRMVPMQIQNENSILILQRILGQVLFYPPNVAGWPGGKNWIDSSALMMRMRIPQLINDADELNVQPKSDDDQMGGRPDSEEMMTPSNARKGARRAGQPINAEVDWQRFTKTFEKKERDQLLPALEQALLQVKPAFSQSLIQSFANTASRESFIQSVTIQLMSTPEYQMC